MAKTAAHASNNLTAVVRTKTGKGASRQARREGKVPAVLYGHGADPRHLELPAREFSAVLRNFGTNAVLTLDIDGEEALALPKSLEIHPIRRNIQHVDLIIVRRGERVTVEINVVVEGDAGPDTLVNLESNTIEIESDAMSIPESLTLSVEGVPANTQFLASQVPLPDGVTLVSDPELLVVNVIPAPTADDLEAEGAGELAPNTAADASEEGDETEGGSESESE
jgi:large subunit ribosomal protein L25